MSLLVSFMLLITAFMPVNAVVAAGSSDTSSNSIGNIDDVTINSSDVSTIKNVIDNSTFENGRKY
ncbi:hypothetical protein [Caldanaerobius polysaccharolyticus]|uniref:hypothetical protein n=1 Tax=Caldanaerobius polysaccharolyticus TaxID=44256 RepID=UPI0012EC09D3|nr:hypothetical protein [Caldanaerobius polysaccharolyticus]